MCRGEFQESVGQALTASATGQWPKNGPPNGQWTSIPLCALRHFPSLFWITPQNGCVLVC